MNQYIISGGAGGRSRLNVLSETLHDYTASHLQALGVKEGSTFLDVGCGGGNVTLLAADLSGPSGYATGIDFDEEIIALNRKEVIQAKRSNVSFHAGSVYDLAYNNEFDFAYARFLLSHLRRPEDVLQKMMRSVKRGGTVIAWDTHFSGHLSYPRSEAFYAYVDLYLRASHNNGHNPDIGPSLYSLFVQAGLTDIGFDIIFPCYHNGTGKRMAYITLDRIKGTLMTQSLATKEEIDNMLRELDTFTKDETTIMSLPHIFRVWGKKE